MACGEANLGKTTQEQGGYQTDFIQVFQLYNFIPFSRCDKLIFECLLIGFFFLHHHKTSLCFGIKSTSVCSYLSNLFMNALFIIL
jgi:hypothetical protein